ncbi:hypothetical protein [Nesterenkonia muleiensis]|uniref:hypothetical protein n=1 Tax=Nesterenkonia muleiensis TaxID=2282648 RepID=UPI00130038CD|nr:hypothetical protein [Nesterenkonia muleiensis]
MTLGLHCLQNLWVRQVRACCRALNQRGAEMLWPRQSHTQGLGSEEHLAPVLRTRAPEQGSLAFVTFIGAKSTPFDGPQFQMKVTRHQILVLSLVDAGPVAA